MKCKATEAEAWETVPEGWVEEQEPARGWAVHASARNAATARRIRGGCHVSSEDARNAMSR